MTKAKTTKRALLTSVLSMMLCMAMLVGSTFAWFTDSVTSGVNKIVAGNLDVELEYLDANGAWQKVTEDTKLFSDMEADGETENLWEPGHTEVVYLKISNVGSLALKYQFSVTASNETKFENALGKTDCVLSDYLVFGQAESSEVIAQYATREEAWAAAGDKLGLESFSKSNEQLKAGEAEYVALIVYMPTTVGNEANYRGDVIPSIDLGVTLFATQTPYEEDSFGKDYDNACQILGVHDVGEWTETKAATCEKAGEKTGICKNCGKTITEAIPALEHEWGSSYAVDLTDFNKHVKICERCNEKQNGSEEGHTFTDNVCTKCNYMNNSNDISSYADVDNVEFDRTNYTATGSFTITFGEQVLTYTLDGQTPLAANNSHPEYGRFYKFKIELNGTERTLYFNVVPTWSNSNGWYVDLG